MKLFVLVLHGFAGTDFVITMTLSAADAARHAIANPSLRVEVKLEGSNSVIEVWGAVAIANSIAILSELLDPKTIVLGLTRRNLMQQSLAYALWGEGEIGLSVYSILVRYWSLQAESQVCRAFCS